MSQLVSLAIALGAGQGLFLALTALVHKKRKRSNLCLALLLITYAYTMAIVSWWEAPSWRPAFFELPHLAGTAAPLPFLFGPLLYGYVLFLVRDRPFARRDAIHLIPFVLLAVLLVPFFAQGAEAKKTVLSSIETGTLPFHDWIAWSRLLHGAAYTLAARSLLRTATERHDSVRRSVARRWARWFVSQSLALHGLVIALLLLERTGLEIDVGALGMLFLAVSIYCITFAQLRESAEIVRTVRPAAYKKSGLDPGRAREIVRRLDAVMKGEAAFADPELGLTDLAERLGSSPHHLSQALNQELGQSFYQHVTELRCREAARRLSDPVHAHRTVLAIGLDAGFGSKAAFNRAFKHFTGATPSAYRRQRSEPLGGSAYHFVASD